MLLDYSGQPVRHSFGLQYNYMIRLMKRAWLTRTGMYLENNAKDEKQIMSYVMRYVYVFAVIMNFSENPDKVTRLESHIFVKNCALRAAFDSWKQDVLCAFWQSTNDYDWAPPKIIRPSLQRFTGTFATKYELYGILVSKEYANNFTEKHCYCHYITSHKTKCFIIREEVLPDRLAAQPRNGLRVFLR
ncbi:19382_t:CDS:2 [Rhizophagus irregularis]|nr:19382_t:CDS:2 [Rhizophagus irregularis]